MKLADAKAKLKAYELNYAIEGENQEDDAIVYEQHRSRTAVFQAVPPLSCTHINPKRKLR